jgi:cysteine desulfurase
MAVYMDCAATTPVLPQVRDEVLHYIDDDFGNAGSRTHEYGIRARAAVERARDRVAEVIAASRGDILFTSGATESNNLAILGLAHSSKKHVISTAIEHHAVLEPVAELERRGFEVERIRPDSSGAIDSDAVRQAIRPNTLLVSVMHVNNETGILQPIEEIASILSAKDVLFHVDAAQSYGREIAALRNPRIDLMSISGHKIHAPKGIGALVMRRRAGVRPPLEPLMFGGGQERGLRPGTLPVSLIAGLGKASELALAECDSRARQCRLFRAQLLEGLAPLKPVINGDPDRSVAHIVNLSIPGVDAETAIDAWKDLVAISHGAACTSQTYTCSHVLGAMDLPEWRQDGALRFSWSHFTPLPDLKAMVEKLTEAEASRSPLAFLPSKP